MQCHLNLFHSKAFAIAGATAVFAIALWLWLRPSEVMTAEVRVREISPAIQGVGTVEAKVVVPLAAKITGRVVNIKVDQGDIVRAGQLLVQLEDAESGAEVERSVANLDRAKLAVHAQQAALLRSQAAFLATEAMVAKARANRSLAHVNAERWDKLAAAELVAKMDLDERKNSAELADAELKSAEALRDAAAKEVAVQQVALNIVPKDIAATAATLASAQARRADTIIKSPIDGYVVSREQEQGAAVNPGTPILKLVDPSTIWITVYVDEREAGSIAVGDLAGVIVRSMPERTLAGKVARIRRESDRVTEQLTVDISLAELPERIALGQQAEAIIRPTAKKVIALSLGALVQTPSGAGAWTVVDDRLRFKRARFGAVDPDGWIEVLQGFSVGDQVVIAPGKLADLKNEGRRVAIGTRTSKVILAEK
jgi:HlyD family secretion protein